MRTWIAVCNAQLGNWVWGTPMILLFAGVGIYFTVKSGFFQFRYAKWIGQKTFFAIFTGNRVTKSQDQKSLSQFQALSTALAATLGNGNIVGVATAISAGGPGAVFWMWVSAAFGMMTHFAESVLGIYFRRKSETGVWSGGPMYYLEEGMHNKRLGRLLAWAFALFCVFASFGIGNMTQVNSISAAMKTSFGLSEWWCGIAIALLAGMVILGGVKRIGQVSEKLVPLMSAFYIVASVITFFMNIQQVPYVFSAIFRSAFSWKSVAGAGSGLVLKRAIYMGFRRGIFSNEAGLGSSVMAHCTADVSEPVEQGMWGIFEVFLDTIVVCTLTAFVLLSSTADLMTMEEALCDLGTEVRYVSLSGESGKLPLVDTYAHPRWILSEGDGNCYSLTTADGKVDTLTFKTPLPEDYVFANVMKVRGIQAKDAQGAALFDAAGKPVIESVSVEEIEGIGLAVFAFSRCFGAVAGKMLSIAVLLFAFATILGWSFYGAQAAEYLWGYRAVLPFKLVFIGAILVGATQSLELVWDISDTFNGLMAIPNLIGLLSLSGLVTEIFNNYKRRKILKNAPQETPLLSAYADVQKKQETLVLTRE